MIKQLFIPLFLVVSLSLMAATPETTIIFVNPAEAEVSPVQDPGLSSHGREQAAGLQHALAGTEVKAVYSTYLNSAIQTIEPLAKERNLKISYYRATENPDIIQSVVAAILKRHKGETVVVCALPQLVPVMARLAGIRPKDVKTLYDGRHGQGLVVKITDQGQAVAQKLNMNSQKKV
jgi:hypothetical protein